MLGGELPPCSLGTVEPATRRARPPTGGTSRGQCSTPAGGKVSLRVKRMCVCRIATRVPADVPAPDRGAGGDVRGDGRGVAWQAWHTGLLRERRAVCAVPRAVIPSYSLFAERGSVPLFEVEVPRVRARAATDGGRCVGEGLGETLSAIGSPGEELGPTSRRIVASCSSDVRLPRDGLPCAGGRRDLGGDARRRRGRRLLLLGPLGGV